MASERAARVRAWIAAAREGDAPVSLAVLCRSRDVIRGTVRIGGGR